jgi:hypothetical protein
LKNFDLSVRATVMKLAYDILSGRLGVIIGSRLLWRAADNLTTALPAEFDIFVEIDSKTEHLNEAHHDDCAEWDCFEAAHKIEVYQACKRVLLFLGDQRQQALETARSVIAGDLSILAGARILGSCSSDADFALLGMIDSDTDHLPVGRERALWNPEILVEKDNEVTHWEELNRSTVLQACKNIIEKLERYDSAAFE